MPFEHIVSLVVVISLGLFACAYIVSELRSFKGRD